MEVLGAGASRLGQTPSPPLLDTGPAAPGMTGTEGQSGPGVQPAPRPSPESQPRGPDGGSI